MNVYSTRDWYEMDNSGLKLLIQVGYWTGLLLACKERILKQSVKIQKSSNDIHGFQSDRFSYFRVHAYRAFYRYPQHGLGTLENVVLVISVVGVA